jgi:hypothetical protein
VSRFITLYRVQLQERHTATGNTEHWLVDGKGTRPFPPFRALEIAQYEGDSGFYLLYIPASGHGTDTYHETLADAMHQAEFEFRVAGDDWLPVTATG